MAFVTLPDTIFHDYPPEQSSWGYTLLGQRSTFHADALRFAHITLGIDIPRAGTTHYSDEDGATTDEQFPHARSLSLR
jgi:hypothetical protein